MARVHLDIEHSMLDIGYSIFYERYQLIYAQSANAFNLSTVLEELMAEC